jgi:hypothetical protein
MDDKVGDNDDPTQTSLISLILNHVKAIQQIKQIL